MSGRRLDGIKVFSATKARDREALGDVVTAWLRANPGLHIIDKTVRLSSGAEFHCLSITLFWGAEGDGEAPDDPAAG